MAMTTEAIARLADAIRQQTLSQAEKIPPQPPVAAVAFKAPPPPTPPPPPPTPFGQRMRQHGFFVWRLLSLPTHLPSQMT